MDGLVVRDLSRRLGAAQVLDGVGFHVPPGTATVVTGPNGAGKTTLLRCIVGADRPDRGDVLLDGRPLDETDPWTRGAVAAVLDDVDFFPDLSVGEHLALLALAHGAAPDGVAEVARGFGLGSILSQLPPTLSSGQRRRLALASCFVRPRRLLVLDEPEQRLDVDGRAWLAEWLVAEKAAGTALLPALMVLAGVGFKIHQPCLRLFHLALALTQLCRSLALLFQRHVQYRLQTPGPLLTHG